jgi:hypothetical protein
MALNGQLKFMVGCTEEAGGGFSDMVNPVNHAAQAQVQTAVQSTQTRQPAPPQPAPAPATDTVQISAAAKALQETKETPAQTAKEASSGDQQAVRLLAKQVAAHAHAQHAIKK